MNILTTEKPGFNSYITSLIKTYIKIGHTVVCGGSNFFESNFVPDILHIHWPDRLYKWHVLADKDQNKQYDIVKSRLDFYKNSNVKIVHTIHDMHPHYEHNSIDRQFYELVIEYSDILVHHCNNSIEIMSKQYSRIKEKTNIVCRHGDYLVDYKDLTMEEARSNLNISYEKFVILNFGNQQWYKGFDNIEKIFSELKINEKFLVNAGNFSYSGFSTFGRELKKIHNYYKNKRNYKRKKYILKVIDLNQIPTLFNAADIVLLGHKHGLNSGVLNMAATFAKPVVFPSIGCFQEQMEKWEHKMYKVNNVSEAAKKVTEYYEMKKNKNFVFNNSNWLKENSWDNHCHKIINSI